jgi:hypothetical protein
MTKAEVTPPFLFLTDEGAVPDGPQALRDSPFAVDRRQPMISWIRFAAPGPYRPPW